MTRPEQETKLHFSRFEIKYVLPQAVREELEQELLYFVELDPFVAEQPGHQYLVRSLYYDDPAMSRYYEKIDGMMRREKFRIRTYGDSASSPAATFLEVKGRHNAQVFKHRIQLNEPAPRSTAAFADRECRDEGFTGGFEPTTRDVLERLPEGALKSKFLGDLYRRRSRPVMLIDYRRRPYFSKFDPAFRLTFDDSLSSYSTSRLFPRVHERRRRNLPGYTILEVKFEHHVPKWFHSAIQGFELRRVSISKYCVGVEAFGLAEKLE